MKQEIADILMRKIKDPRIGFVTVTDVEVSHDLRNAKVFVSIYGDEKSKKETLKGLESAAPFIRSELAGACGCALYRSCCSASTPPLNGARISWSCCRSIEEEKDPNKPHDE